MRTSFPDLRRLSGELAAVAVIAAACAIYWWDALALRGVFFFYDHALQNFPYRLFFARGLAEGDMPLWTSSLFCGFPLFAETQGNPLYPLFTLLFGSLKPWVAYNYYTVLHYFLAGFFTYVLARTFSVRRVGAVVAAVCYMFCGPVITHTHHTNIVVGIAYLPLLLALIELTFRRRTPLPAFLLSLATAALILGAQPQYVLYNALACGLFLTWRMALVWRSDGSGSGPRPALKLGAACAAGALLGAAIAAVQLLPFAELVSHSSRGASGASMAVGTSLPPAQLITLFLPHYFGTPGLESYWIGKEVGLYAEHAIFLGVGPLVLALVAIIADRRQLTLFLLGAGFLSFLFSLGMNGPLQRLFVSVPLFRGMRFPGRFAYFLALCVALLAGIGADNLRTLRDRDLLTRRAVLAGLAIVLGISALCILLAGHYSAPLRSLSQDGLKAALSLPGDGAGVLHNYLHEVLPADVRRLAVASCATALLVAAGMSRFVRPGYIVVLCPLLVFGELAFHARAEYAVTDPALYDRAPRFARNIKQHGKGRIFHHRWWHARLNAPGRVVYPQEQGAATKPAAFQDSLAALPPNSHMLWNVPAVSGFSPLQTRRMKRLLGAPDNVQTMIPFGLSHPLDLLGARYIITAERELPGDFRLLEEAGPYRLFENPNALPRSFIVHRARTYADPEKAVQALQDPSFDYRATVLLPEGADAQSHGAGPAEEEEEARIVRDAGDSLTVRARLQRPGYLVLADQFYPGWQARVDGRRVPVLRADYLLRGVLLRAGEHTIRFLYRPRSFTLGAIATIGALTVLFCWVLVAALRRARNGPPRQEDPPLVKKARSQGSFNLVLFAGVAFVLASPFCNTWYWKHAATQLDPRTYAAVRHQLFAARAFERGARAAGLNHLLKAFRRSLTDRRLRAALLARCSQHARRLLEENRPDEAARWLERMEQAAPVLSDHAAWKELKAEVRRAAEGRGEAP